MVEGALADALAETLRSFPDVFAPTRLSPATVAEWAAIFAEQLTA